MAKNIIQVVGKEKEKVIVIINEGSAAAVTGDNIEVY